MLGFGENMVPLFDNLDSPEFPESNSMNDKMSQKLENENKNDNSKDFTTGINHKRKNK